MEQNIIKVTVGPLGTNCLIIKTNENNAILIDPGFEIKRIADTIQK
ncbi:MAG: hypothetical protein K0R90_1306, partial [Oscillospiraceae bacterium]|nr:hypothetical protein [Oscillospiraceae bacterium]